MTTAPPLIVVSDLDGTLLDHHDYGFAAAQPALDRLSELGIPLLLNTSKTRAEMLPLRRALGNREPFMVENGSALVGDDACVWHAWGTDRAELMFLLKRLRGEFQFEGFSDWSVDALVEHTGLAPSAARLAAMREFSEPLLWRDSESAFAAFEQQINSQGLQLLRGGRFVHVMGQTDKGRPLGWLRDHYRSGDGPAPTLIALGDSHNDIDMLNAADIAVRVRSPVQPPPAVSAPRVITTEQEGPAGWGQCINALLDELLEPRPAN